MSDIDSLLEEHVQPHEASAGGVNLIVKWVMAIYAFAIFGCVLYLGYRGIYFNEDVFDNVAEIIKVAVVPVVTFVIGYYFACERDRNNRRVRRKLGSRSKNKNALSRQL
jgi:uncharacterized membrane protein